MSLKGRLTTIERLASAKDDIVVVLVKGGFYRGHGFARDPDSGRLIAHQAAGESTDAFVERATAEARARGVRCLVVWRGDQ